MIYVILLIIVSYILFFFGNGAFPLIGDSEGNYAELAREMLELKNFIVPHLNYVPYIEKPPFFYWLTSFSYWLFGENEASARLWSAIPALGLVLLTYVSGRRLKDRALGLYSALVIATSVGFIMMSKICYMDMLFAFLIGLSLVLFFYGLETSKKVYFYLFYCILALAILTKGFAGAILPGLVIFVYFTVTGSWRRIKDICLLRGILLFLIIAVPWHIAAAIKNKEFLWYYFVNEHLYRYLGIRYPKDYFHGPIYYHVLRLFAMLFPWSIFIPASIYLYIKKIGRRKDWMFYMVWFLTILIFFSISKAKANYYMLIGLAPVALFVGSIWTGGMIDLTRKIERRFFGVTYFIYILAGFVCLMIIYVYPKLVTDNLPFSFLPMAVTMLVLLTISGLVSSYLFFRNRLRPAFLVFFAGAFLAGFIVSQNLPSINDEESARIYAEIINKNYKEGDIIVIRGKYERNSTASFYLKKQAYVVCEPWRVDGDLDFGSRYPDARKYFITWDEFNDMYKRDKRVFLITKEPWDVHELKIKYPKKTDLLYHSDGRYLLTNR